MVGNIMIEMEHLENILFKLSNLQSSFDYVKLSIASPNKIRNWAKRLLPGGHLTGNIFLPLMYNFKTRKPEKNGLFCEMTFGPIVDWTCSCGKYINFNFQNLDKICNNCHVELTESRVRRYRMGYIELNSPVVHFWYLKGRPNYLLTILKSVDESLTAKDMEKLVYFKEGSRIISQKSNFSKPFFNNKFFNFLSIKDKIGENDNLYKYNKFSQNNRRFGIEVLKSILDDISLPLEVEKTRDDLIFFSNYRLGKFKKFSQKMYLRRLRLFENLLSTNTHPSWMILTVLPVLPPYLRPLIELENGIIAYSDLNIIYKVILSHNSRLLESFSLKTFEVTKIKYLLQLAVDSLIDNSKVDKDKKFIVNNKPLKTLSEILEGKEGRFRHSLLGKRVDYSARSVIVVNPILRLDQCGMPYEILVTIFKPFLINKLINIKTNLFYEQQINNIINDEKPFIWFLLENLISKYYLLLNRAPTLHRVGVQAFNPILISGEAIQLHPLVCTGFNADFDGDQMGVYLPVSDTAQLESRFLMRPMYNIVSPSNGNLTIKPTQDMIIGCYYLTIMLSKTDNFLKKWFVSEEEALFAFYQKKLNLHVPILIRYNVKMFSVFIQKSEFYITLKNSFDSKLNKLIIYKVLKYKNNICYIICNLGILVAKIFSNNKFEITHIFIETTVGRLIFSLNVRELYNRYKELK